MTQYVGETTRVATWAFQPDGTTRITNAEVTSVVVTIFSTPDYVAVVTNAAMTWDAVTEEWAYDWNTTAATAGNFEAKCIITGSSFVTFDYKRFRLSEIREV